MLINILALVGGAAGFVQLARGNNGLGASAVLVCTSALVLNAVL
jgi:hypothetical protein